MVSHIKDSSLWEAGELKLSWVRSHMPLLEGIEKDFKETQPFKGLKVALSVHLEAKTAHLCEVFAAGGAEMYITGSANLLAGLFGGSLVLEIIFAYPGIGRLMYEAVMQEDINLVLANTMFISALVLIGMIISDILLALVDPRIRYR